MIARANMDPKVRQKLLHEITKDSNRKYHVSGAHALAIMLDALNRAESDERGIFDGICDNFCGRLAHRLLRAAGFEVTPEIERRIR